MATCTTAPDRRLRPTQPGSHLKKWDEAELRQCGAIGTTEKRKPDLSGEIHPVFTNWAPHADDPTLRDELRQPLLLAGRLLEAAGLPWLSDLFVDDGNSLTEDANPSGHRHHYGIEPGPPAIARRHRAPWAGEELGRAWLDDTRQALGHGSQNGSEFTLSLEWQLDASIFRERGWVGYTCRHRRNPVIMTLDELDDPDVIAQSDDASRGQGRRYRDVTVLVMAEFPARLRELGAVADTETTGERGGEFLLTAFMAAITILHELGHAAYWKDRRPLTRDLREPFYGADLEMELGDSFVASVFGGWIPVPIGGMARAVQGPLFEKGIAWKQALSWDHHRMRPKHRAHYSIPVDYVATLFSEEAWSAHKNDTLRLIRPNIPAADTELQSPSSAQENKHATAALPDFHRCADGWAWKRRPGAYFRIPQYDGDMYPDIDLPIAPEGVVIEPVPLSPPALPLASSLRLDATIEEVGEPISDPTDTKPHHISKLIVSIPGLGRPRNMTPQKAPPSGKDGDTGATKKKLRLSNHQLVGAGVLSPERREISLDELKKRLSQMIGVSLGELEKLFETSRCS